MPSHVEIGKTVHHINYRLVIINVDFINTIIDKRVVAIQSELRSELTVQGLNSYVIVVIAINRYFPTLTLVDFPE
jgi:hypothetical protein